MIYLLSTRMCSQGLLYNMVSIDCQEVTLTSGIFHPDLSKEIQSVIDVALHTKFREDKVISKFYTQAHNLLLFTSSASEFLFHLLMLKHPKLSPMCLAFIDIPKYSTTSCLLSTSRVSKTSSRTIYKQSVIY